MKKKYILVFTTLTNHCRNITLHIDVKGPVSKGAGLIALANEIAMVSEIAAVLHELRICHKRLTLAYFSYTQNNQ